MREARFCSRLVMSGRECLVAITSCRHTFSSSVSRNETTKPVWRENVCATMCDGRGVYQLGSPGAPWRPDGGKPSSISCQTVSFAVASAAVLLALEGTVRPTPQQPGNLTSRLLHNHCAFRHDCKPMPLPAFYGLRLRFAQ